MDTVDGGAAKGGEGVSAEVLGTSVRKIKCLFVTI